MARLGRATALAGAGLLALAGCGGSGNSTTPGASSDSASSSSPTTEQLSRIEAAAKKCGMSGNVDDGGLSISFDTQGKEDTSGDTVTDSVCVLVELGMPTFVAERMDSTRAMDGVQKETWDGIEARWSYHPDSGLSLSVVDRKLMS